VYFGVVPPYAGDVEKTLLFLECCNEGLADGAETGQNEGYRWGV
jgi:hypothetical protein